MGEEELRRSYSICSSPFENELRVAIKRLSGGRFSSHANQKFQIGDLVEVLPPSGKFNTTLNKTHTKNYLAFAAGSGITPVISIIKSTLASEPGSRFTLIYGNRNRSSIIFKEQLEGIKNRYMDRFALHHILSREKTEAEVYHGRINAEKCEQLAKGLIDLENMDHIFLCGPQEMIFSTKDWLLNKGIEKGKIHFELFNVPGQKAAEKIIRDPATTDKMSRVSLKLDGVIIEFDLAYEGQAILDAALAHGAELPFACKGGVCATCKAKLIKGKVEMDNNYALETEELSQGYILTCQSHPRTEAVEVDFDMK
jgi:ring-1,2-phenylacetyl-CoA epoxidase subunit PaaE